MRALIPLAFSSAVKTGSPILLAALVSAAPAAAQDAPGTSPFYLELFGGLGAINDNALATANAPGEPVLQTFFLDHDEGALVGLRVGRAFGDDWRADVELSFRSNDLGELTSPGNIITPGYSFDIDTTALMVNGYFDFRPLGAVTPYIGAGLGVASVRTEGSIAPGDPGFDYSFRQSVPAAQLRVGATVAVSDRMDVGLEYTHFRAFGIDDNLSDAFFDTLTEDYKSDSVSVLVRLRF